MRKSLNWITQKSHHHWVLPLSTNSSNDNPGEWTKPYCSNKPRKNPVSLCCEIHAINPTNQTILYFGKFVDRKIWLWAATPARELMVLQSKCQGSVDWRNLFSAGILSQKCLPTEKSVKCLPSPWLLTTGRSLQRCRSREVKHVNPSSQKPPGAHLQWTSRIYYKLHGGRMHTRGNH